MQDEEVLDNELKTNMQKEENQEPRNLLKILNETKGYQPPANRTLFLNCSTPNVVCNTVKCTAGPFDSTPQASAVIAIMMTLKISDLGMFI
jgi:hypothetical protein